MQLLLYWLVKHFQVLYYLHHFDSYAKALCSEQKRLQKSRKHKIKQLTKYTVQIMGMGSTSVFMVMMIINYTQSMYSRVSSVSSPLAVITQVSTHKTGSLPDHLFFIWSKTRGKRCIIITYSMSSHTAPFSYRFCICMPQDRLWCILHTLVNWRYASPLIYHHDFPSLPVAMRRKLNLSSFFFIL